MNGKTFGIQLETAIGSLVMSFRNESRLDVKGGDRIKGITVNGKACSMDASLQLVDGRWIVARTESGNESAAALDVCSWEGNSRIPAGKKIRDAVRPVLVEAVNAYLSANPDVVATARVERITFELRNQKDQLARAKEQVARLEKSIDKLEGELCEHPQLETNTDGSLWCISCGATVEEG